ncbi:UdgX family uracil-DNA binding protein [Paramicrobacterium agarici]|uniref:Type-4 uracil-DNA glycosylase n=1 Tax=Paramicrobacterium agarici TaxID=630514 RepID=A0A2A9DY56_9MICO|nr:UdgX family uracil-DNA binding protein [Microbacterium agarici]PFG31524.1 DNA polymerase [Microbacterium agarici]
MSEPERPGADEWVPNTVELRRLRAAVQDCRGCELWRDTTQAVFSSGTRSAALMFVGEQPGDREDVEGEPFVGPAGCLLDRALDAAGIARSDAYLTNAVKHFRHAQRGKKRIHEKPAVGHIVACHPWLDAELRAVDPDVIVCLGATAGRAVLGRPTKVTAERGHPLVADGRDQSVVVTTHPSAVLRVREEAQRDAAFAALVDDLIVARDISAR